MEPTGRRNFEKSCGKVWTLCLDKQFQWSLCICSFGKPFFFLKNNTTILVQSFTWDSNLNLYYIHWIFKLHLLLSYMVLMHTFIICFYLSCEGMGRVTGKWFLAAILIFLKREQRYVFVASFLSLCCLLVLHWIKN